MPESLSDHLMVIDRKTGQEVKNAIILDPVNDRHARAGLIGYAESAEATKPELAFKIKRFVSRLDDADQKQQRRIAEIPDWLIEQSRDQEDADASK